jgi:hypothetical protein
VSRPSHNKPVTLLEKHAEYVQSSKQFFATIEQQQQNHDDQPHKEQQPAINAGTHSADQTGLQRSSHSTSASPYKSPEFHTKPSFTRTSKGGANDLSYSESESPMYASMYNKSSHKETSSSAHTHRPSLHATGSRPLSGTSSTRAPAGAILAALHTHAEEIRDKNHDVSYDKRLVDLLPRKNDGEYCVLDVCV